MNQGQSAAFPIPGGAITIQECSNNTAAAKLPLLTIMLAAVQPSTDGPAQPAESLTLSPLQVEALYAALTDYYGL